MTTRRTQSGFSLLELLVVILIIGILSTMFSLSVGLVGDDRELETETDRLVAVVNLASDEAVMQGREIGMRFHPDGYEFATFVEDFVEYYDTDEDAQSNAAGESDEPENTDQSEWVVLSHEKLLGQRQLPEGILLELEIDGRLIVLDTKPYDEDDEDDQDREYEPQIRIFSSGEVSPFIVQLRRTFQNKGVRIAFDFDGAVEITKDLQ